MKLIIIHICTLLLVFFTDTKSVCQPSLNTSAKDMSAITNTKRFSLSYQAAYYYDPVLSIFYPIGLNLEYKLGKAHSSLDFQTILHHPKASYIDEYGYYQFISFYYIQYDLGLRLYFDSRKNDLIGAYFRPSIGITTVYSRIVTHDLIQNVGYEASKVRGKEFIGLQLGYKSKLNNLFFASGSIGTLVSFFKTDNETNILFSPHVNINLGIRF